MDKFSLFLEKYSYFGKGEELRNQKYGENEWQQMMNFAKPVSSQEFLKNINTNEKIASAINPNTRFFKSMWHGKDVYFLDLNGSQYIFTQDDAINF